MKMRRTYTREFKLKVLRECENGKGKAQLSRENGLHTSLISRWEKEFKDDLDRLSQNSKHVYKPNAFYPVWVINALYL